MAGRTGLVKEDGTFEGVVYMPCTAENNFTPETSKTACRHDLFM